MPRRISRALYAPFADPDRVLRSTVFYFLENEECIQRTVTFQLTMMVAVFLFSSGVTRNVASVIMALLLL
jgi:hypothetical protein